MPKVEKCCNNCVTELTTEQVCLPTITMKVRGSDGSLINSKGVDNVVRDATGLYTVTLSQPHALGAEMQFSGIVVYEDDTTGDSIEIHPFDITATSFRVNISEGDNGTANNTNRDRDWWATILVEHTIITSAVTECDGEITTGECKCQSELDILQTQINNFTDTNDVDYISNVSVAGNTLVFTAVGNAFSGTVILPLVTPSTIIPISDNEVDTAIRTGQIGTSLLYARADHNHPIRRQSLLPDPVLTYGLANGSTAPQTIVLDRWSDEETITYAYRVRMDIQTGNGWEYIIVPNIAGFQRPQITVEGTYRSTGNPQRDEAGIVVNDGAMPTAPYMGNEANHWSSTQRVYVGPFVKQAFARYYVAVTIKYTRL